YWGARRIAFELGRKRPELAPSESAVYRWCGQDRNGRARHPAARLVFSSEGPSKMPEAWIRPLVNDSVPQVSYAGSGSRMVLVLSPKRQALVGAVFFLVCGTMADHTESS
ncbi:MAG: hypothetical protein ACXVBB_23340, partial [Isosphaeraceae bacterium]